MDLTTSYIPARETGNFYQATANCPAMRVHPRSRAIFCEQGFGGMAGDNQGNYALD